MQIVDSAKKRYATKVFDPSKKIDVEMMAQVEDLLRLSPSSVNSQPWHFIIAESLEGKKRIAKATQGSYSFNEAKIYDASHVIVFCSRIQMNDDHLTKVTEQEWADGRFPTQDAKEEGHQKRCFFVGMHRDLGDLPHWSAKQVYLNLGAFLLGVGALGLDAVPIEGFDSAALDKEFDLQAQGLTSSVLVAVGYRAEDDFNAKLPKSRLPADDIITRL